ncbi:MAG TPA: ribbon-helix-helix domain-containing protein [Acetobacteraceae bacterium]|nr:ribbon-helix-helix domain-containing protein [Acetobacteraceae bacterium]
MSKRPSLFAPKPDKVSVPEPANEEAVALPAIHAATRRPPSREGKRVLSIYLDPLAWKQLRQLALDADTSTQALGEEAVNLLFAKHGINRSA